MVLRAHVTEGKAGSIGPTWPPALTNSHRLRGIYPGVLATRRQSETFVDEIHRAQQANPDFSRISIRTFVTRDEHRRLGTRWNGVKVEGIIPVDHVVAPGVDLVYLGHNDTRRTPDPAVFANMLIANFGMVGQVQLSNPNLLMERVSARDYVVERLTRTTLRSKDIQDLVALYHEALPVYMLEITPQTMRDLLDAPDNIFLVARNKSRIASALIAEHTTIEVDGKPVHLYELSDFATFRAHQGNGLMTALQVDAIRRIRSEHGDNAIVYAEDRAPWPAVARSSLQAGLSLAGVLPSHVKIGGVKTFNEGVPDMETLLPVALLPSGIVPPSPNAILALHGVSL